MNSIITKYNDKRYLVRVSDKQIIMTIWTGDPPASYVEQVEITDNKITLTFRKKREDTTEIIGSKIIELFKGEIEELKKFPEHPKGEEAKRFAEICETILTKVSIIEKYSQ